VAHPTGWGILDGIKQPVELNTRKAEALKGAILVACLHINLQTSPNLLVICVYDNKPVHLLSMVVEDSVEWRSRRGRSTTMDHTR
jgi:hypothetical protein